MIAVCKTIIDQLAKINVSCELLEWTQVIKYPYWTLEYTKDQIETEDGLAESAVILCGFTRERIMALELQKEKIKTLYRNGVTVLSPGGDSVSVFYDNGFPVPTGDPELKKVEVYLTIKKWSA